MKYLVSKLLMFLLWTMIPGCQPPTAENQRSQIAALSTPTAAVEIPTAIDPQVEIDRYEMVGQVGETKAGKLSGIVFYQPRKTLFVVSDNGRISELKTDGTFIRGKKLRAKADFEGITYNPGPGMLYIAVEGEEIILEVDPDSLKMRRDIPIDRVFEGRTLLSPKGNGIEGITFVPAGDKTPDGSFFLVNQSDELSGPDPSIVFEVAINDATNRPQARIIRYFSIGITDLSGIQYIPASRSLLIVSDANDLLLEVSLAGQVLQTYPLPGKQQEGVTTDEDSVLYIAQDTKDPSLQKFISLVTP